MVVCCVVLDPPLVDNKFGIDFRSSNTLFLIVSGININKSSIVPVFVVKNSVILECLITDNTENLEFITNSIKYRSIIVDIWKTMPTNQILQNTSFNLSASDIKKIVRETVEEVLSENGLMVESTQKSNELMTIKVGKHIFEGKISKIKKVQ